MVLVVNINGVGDDMLSIPITATCKAPKVRIEPKEELDFGKVFLDFEEQETIELINDSNLKAKFQITPQSRET
jgi:hydrocephalus-inducing protein